MNQQLARLAETDARNPQISGMRDGTAPKQTEQGAALLSTEKLVFSLDEIAQQLDMGAIIPVGADGIISFAFMDFRRMPGPNNASEYEEGVGYAPFTVAQRLAAREAISAWDDLISPRFVEVAPGPGASSWGQKNEVDIWFANTTTGYAAGWSYFPESEPNDRLSSDVWITDPSVVRSNNWLTNLSPGKFVIVHELGHSLGLEHAGSYEYVPGIPLNYTNNAEYAQDSYQYTVMSYWGAANTGARVVNWMNLSDDAKPQTPMLHDVYAIQQKYGADPNTRADATVYGFNSSAGNPLLDFTENPYPFLTLYDAGGTDCIDLSGFKISQFVDLHAGAFSSIGAGVLSAAEVNEYLNDLSRATGIDWGKLNPTRWTALMEEAATANANSISADLVRSGRMAVEGIGTSEYLNFSIAHGVTIENAIGGSARDLLWGNEAANTLKGMAGDDVLNGFEGADLLYGGNGNDTFMFSHVENGDRIMDWNRGDKIDLREIDVDSQLAGDQHFSFIAESSFTGVTGQLRYMQGLLEGDLNGDGAADFALTIIGSPGIGVNDLIL